MNSNEMNEMNEMNDTETEWTKHANGTNEKRSENGKTGNLSGSVAVLGPWGWEHTMYLFNRIWLLCMICICSRIWIDL